LAYFIRLDSSGPNDPLMNLLAITHFGFGVAAGGAFLAGIYGIGRAVLAGPRTDIQQVSP
jgi:hypothetical protein